METIRQQVLVSALTYKKFTEPCSPVTTYLMDIFKFEMSQQIVEYLGEIWTFSFHPWADLGYQFDIRRPYGIQSKFETVAARTIEHDYWMLILHSQLTLESKQRAFLNIPCST